MAGKTLLVAIVGIVTAGMSAEGSERPHSDRPNVVLIYADDVGYGDLGCYGAADVATPSLDALAAAGLRFTDAHSPSATCTPSRYALLTGEYAWRREGIRVLRGDAPLVIEPGRFTLPQMLRQAGYATGLVGKWHLGLGTGRIDWNGEIGPGPLDVGFGSAFFLPATGDRVPCVYVDGRRVVGLDPGDPLRVDSRQPIGDEPTGSRNPERLRVTPSHGHDMAIVNGVSRIGYSQGGARAQWVDEEMADVLAARANAFIEQHRAGPFFLLFATHDIHVPRLPHPRFAGTTPLGPRGDALVQLDWCVGQVLEKLRELGLADDTIVIFSSDNGPVLDDGYRDEAVTRLGTHRPAGPLRGGKYSNFEGGTRVPLLVRWPARVRPGVSHALVGQQDLLASLARLVGVPLPSDAAPDSIDVLEALLGDDPTGRTHIVADARALAYREGPWKVVEPSPGPRVHQHTGVELGNAAGPQLYDLAADPGETRNLAADQPDRAAAMLARLQAIRIRGRSR